MAHLKIINGNCKVKLFLTVSEEVFLLDVLGTHTFCHAAVSYPSAAGP